jgi:hypothetical protein
MSSIYRKQEKKTHKQNPKIYQKYNQKDPNSQKSHIENDNIL